MYDGRGRWSRWGKKPCVTEFLALDIRKLVRYAGGLDPVCGGGCHVLTSTWTRGATRRSSIQVLLYPGLQRAELVYQVDKSPVQVTVPLVYVPLPRRGGVRPLWCCPRCGRRCCILYGHPFVCRVCANATYATAQDSRTPITRIEARLSRILAQVGGHDVTAATFPAKPAGVGLRRYARLRAQWATLRELRDDAWLYGLYAFMTPSSLRTEFPDLAALLEELKPDPLADYRQEVQAWRRSPPELVHLAAKSRQQPQQRAAPANRLTVGQLARAAGVAPAFIHAARREQLLRPDQGRTTRRVRYRAKLAGWVRKLAALREQGLEWAELLAWSRRRWLPGHEHERQAPAELSSEFRR